MTGTVPGFLAHQSKTQKHSDLVIASKERKVGPSGRTAVFGASGHCT